MSSILVIENESLIVKGLRDNLEFDGYQVLEAADGETGLRLVRERRPDLIVLDLMLPRLSGYEVCRRLRAEKIEIPILMLTARAEEVDRVLGLDLGADDYVTKPFSVPELLARIRALLRRAHAPANLPADVRFGGVLVDFLRFEAFRNGKSVELTRKEFALLRLLAERPGVAIMRDELLEKAWGYEATQSTRTVDNHIASLRSKLEEKPGEPVHLITIHGFGYKLVVTVPGN
ncbi:MAG TPA: response regulator transcription factor [Bryobacteraceae bacterium]|nr:response regulator transcription factor [Bryobacteraceae bacterium]